MGYDFVDMDKAIERERNMSIAEIFAKSGEEAFRDMEREFLERFDGTDANIIVAVGGGAACYGDNIHIMNSKGRTVYFKVSPEKLYDRLERNRNKRPKLAGLDDRQLADFIDKTLSEREPYYSQASVTIDCEGVSDSYVAEHLAHYIENYRDETKE